MQAIGTGIGTALLGGIMNPQTAQPSGESPYGTTTNLGLNPSDQATIDKVNAGTLSMKNLPRQGARTPARAIFLEYWPIRQVMGGGIMPANGLDAMQRLAGYKHVGLIVDDSLNMLGPGKVPIHGQSYDLQSRDKAGPGSLQLNSQVFKVKTPLYNSYEFVGMTTMSPEGVKANGECIDLFNHFWKDQS